MSNKGLWSEVPDLKNSEEIAGAIQNSLRYLDVPNIQIVSMEEHMQSFTGDPEPGVLIGEIIRIQSVYLDADEEELFVQNGKVFREVDEELVLVEELPMIGYEIHYLTPIGDDECWSVATRTLNFEMMVRIVAALYQAVSDYR